MQLHETIEILKKIYMQNLTEQNFYSSCLLISWYTENELKKLFIEKNEIAQYLEPFLINCYISRRIINTLEDEFIKLNKIFDNNNDQNAFSFVYSYINCLKEIADNFDKLNIQSSSLQYSKYYDQFEEFQNECLNILKYSDFKFKYPNGETVFNREKSILFEDNSELLKTIENEFINKIIYQINLEDIKEVEEIIYFYYEAKFTYKNYLDDYQREKLNELCTFVSNNNKNSSDELIVNYNLATRLNNNAIKCYMDILEKSFEFENSVYVGIYHK